MVNTDLLLAYGATYKKVTKDELIFLEGSHCCFYYQVVEGRIRWVNIDDDGKEFIQGIMEKDECFGELPLFDDLPYAATAIADEASVILRLSKSSFLQLLKDNSEINMHFSKLLATRLRFKFLMISELASHGPVERIARLMHYFKQNGKYTCKNCKKVNLTRQQIANMTGLRVETVIRAIRQLAEQGVLSIERGKVYC